MPKILLPPKDGVPLKDCTGRKAAVARGSYFEFEVSQEEYRFWKNITNEEREKLRLEGFEKCFYDALKEYMGIHQKKRTSPFQS